MRPTIREATYSNIKCPSDNDNGDIYNHLNEKENPGADLDDYDHAHPSTDHGATDGDYCHLNSKPERGMEPQQNGDVYDTSGSVQSRYHYFTLENRNVSWQFFSINPLMNEIYTSSCHVLFISKINCNVYILEKKYNFRYHPKVKI